MNRGTQMVIVAVGGALLLAAGACSKSPPPQVDAAAHRAPPAPAPAARATAAVAHATAWDGDTPIVVDDERPVFDDDSDDPGDAPHPDRALGRRLPPDADQRVARGFILNDVPDDVAVYVPPPGEDGVWTYLVYDEGHDHIATIRERRASATARDPAALWPSRRSTALDAFAVWPSSFSEGQRKLGGGQRVRFSGPFHDYEIDTLGTVGWILGGWEFRKAHDKAVYKAAADR